VFEGCRNPPPRGTLVGSRSEMSASTSSRAKFVGGVEGWSARNRVLPAKIVDRRGECIGVVGAALRFAGGQPSRFARAAASTIWAVRGNAEQSRQEIGGGFLFRPRDQPSTPLYLHDRNDCSLKRPQPFDLVVGEPAKVGRAARRPGLCCASRHLRGGGAKRRGGAIANYPHSFYRRDASAEFVPSPA